MTMQGSVDIPLHDIKPLVEIHEYSLAVLGILSIASVFTTIALVYLLWNYFKSRKKVNIRLECFKALKNIDLSKPKEAAYLITKYGRCFANDSVRIKEAFENLVLRLEPYKYKKEVEEIDREAASFYRIYIGMIDV